MWWRRLSSYSVSREYGEFADTVARLGFENVQEQLLSKPASGEKAGESFRAETYERRSDLLKKLTALLLALLRRPLWPPAKADRSPMKQTVILTKPPLRKDLA
mgnify:CR=1 FL=1